MKASRLLAAIVWAVLLASPALPQAKTPSTDDALVDQVRVKLSLDVDVNGGALEVTVKDGVATLRGSVRNDRARKKAEKIAAKVKGIKKVVNQINVTTAP